MFVFVRTLGGASWEVEVTRESTGYDVKRGVQTQADIPIGEQLLIFGGRRVEDDMVISAINPEYEMMVVRHLQPAKLVASKSSCSVCGQETVSACTQCDVPYCGRECQTADWGKHKLTCKGRD
jgi:hypothetical protein